MAKKKSDVSPFGSMDDLANSLSELDSLDSLPDSEDEILSINENKAETPKVTKAVEPAQEEETPEKRVRKKSRGKSIYDFFVLDEKTKKEKKLMVAIPVSKHKFLKQTSEAYGVDMFVILSNLIEEFKDNHKGDVKIKISEILDEL
ncbi:hypothetical protein [Flexithrix dorotheae]|uniref:hypothetical protein n=1 Tax=Flexithrix dorotheae TaxID=70993 RepID=UPI00037F6620|nr:hypothetical protein [Flexithrix dorotheae]